MSLAPLQRHDFQSYGGTIMTFVVPSGATGSLVAPVDARAPHSVWRVACSNPTGIAAGSRLRLQGGWATVTITT